MSSVSADPSAIAPRERTKLGNSRKNDRLIDHYADYAARYLAQTITEDRITSLTVVDELRQAVYMAVADEANTEVWSNAERKAAHAVLRDAFDGNLVTLDYVIRGADEHFPGLTASVISVFNRVVDKTPDLAERLYYLPGIQRRRRLQYAS